MEICEKQLKAVLVEKFMLNTYIKGKKKSQANNLNFHVKKVEKKEQHKNANRRKEILKTKAEISKIKNKTSRERQQNQNLVNFKSQ